MKPTKNVGEFNARQWSRKLQLRRLLLTLSLLCLGATHALEVRTEVRLCGKGEAYAIFGKSLEGCVIYDVQSQATKLVVQFCSGLKVGAGAEAVIGGAGADVSLLFCTTVEVPMNNQSRLPKDLLEDPEIQQQLKEKMHGSVQNILRGLEEKHLTRLKLPRAQIDQLEIKSFATFSDHSGNEKVRTAVATCKRILLSS